ncbi:hypothetical protein HanIR_Chr09g0430891 [Helianthus annuus]|nr:hypothetical protein HanIR_Chr09g0430891 [Helianthus annuus]
MNSNLSPQPLPPPVRFRSARYGSSRFGLKRFGSKWCRLKRFGSKQFGYNLVFKEFYTTM